MSLTAFSTNSLERLDPPDSVKCFQIDEAKVLLKFANKGLKCDSLLLLKEKETNAQADIIRAKDEQLEISTNLITKQKTRLDKADRKIKRNRVYALALGGAALFEFIWLVLIYF